MTESHEGDHGVEQGAQRLATIAETMKDAWARTIEDMRARAEAYEEQDWAAITVAAGDTAPEHPDAGPAGRFGFVHVLPGDTASEIRETVEDGEFSEYDVFRATASGRVFLVTELLDPDSRTVICVAGSYELRTVGPLVAAADEAGVCYTHLQTLDGTVVGSFEHEDYEKFVPRVESFRD